MDDTLAKMMKMYEPMDASEALARLRALTLTLPTFTDLDDNEDTPAEVIKWVGDLEAVITAMKRTSDGMEIRLALKQLMASEGRTGAETIRAVLYRAIAAAELEAPASAQGAFIASGDKLDAFAAISKVIASGESNVMLVDPYMDGTSLTDFMTAADEGVTVRVMSDASSVKPTLQPAASKWREQFGAARPLEVKLSPKRTLHDRLLLIDGKEAWSLTQSLKDFAARSPGSLLKANPEAAELKIAAYEQLWDQAEDMI